MDTIDFEKFETLSEEEKEAVSSRWTNEDWCEYYKFMGTVTIDDFFQELEEEAIKMAMEKYQTTKIKKNDFSRTNTKRILAWRFHLPAI